MYVTWGICADCARAAILCGIRKIYTHSFYDGTAHSPTESTEAATLMLLEAGVELVPYHGKVMLIGDTCYSTETRFTTDATTDARFTPTHRSRDRNEAFYDLVQDTLAGMQPRMVIHGDENGVDSAAGHWAQERRGRGEGSPQWHVYEKKAGPVRNEDAGSGRTASPSPVPVTPST